MANYRDILSQLNLNVLEWMTETEKKHVTNDILFMVQDGLFYDLNLVGINKHVPETNSFRIVEYMNPKTHRLIRLLNCKIHDCGKIFRRWHNFFDHLRTHTKERPYSCRICEISFTQKANLDKHIIIHQGIKKFKC